MNAPWRWAFVKETDPCTPEERAEMEYTWEGNYDGFLPLKDVDGSVIADYAGCGSHEIRMTPEHAAIIEAANEMFNFVWYRMVEGDARANCIIESIKARQEEFSK